jgi:ATP-dependent DNA helicase DinG
MSLDYRDVLDENGLVSKRMPRYEARRQQLDLAGAVDDAIREGHHLVAEAGTGVGKSFAYLIPSILYAVDDQNHPENYPLGIETPTPRRVVISTHTIALQEQLFHKDIP